MAEPLVAPHVLEYPGGYTRSVGPVIGRFLTGLRAGRIEAVKLEVPIAAEFPLAQAAKAQERVEAGHILGKIVLRIR